MSLRTKILLAMALLALLVAGAVTAAQQHFRRGELVAEFQAFVRSVAGTAALSIDGRDLAAVRTNADAAAPEFRRVRELLGRVRDVNRLRDGEVYVLRPDDRDPFDTAFVCMPHAAPFVGDRYTILPQNRAAFAAAWRGGEPAATGVYSDHNGTYISAYAPVLDRTTGRPVAVLEIDAEITRFIERQRATLATAVAVGGAAFCVAVVPGWLLATSLTRGVNRLADGIRRFQAGDHQARLAVGRSGDEIQRVGEAFNDMIGSLAERLALLPYVSRFTAEAVRRGRDDPAWLTGAERDVVVLFADLRGFTGFSEYRPATDVVRELNALLGLQADVVLSAGGDVDKFIGDRVMALFLDDDRRTAAATAFACARDMIDRLRAAAGAGGLALGVGIHRGRAVVGSIGSAARRDFTAIGHTVNLASRLCDRAEPWQVLVSGDVHDALPPPDRARLVPNPPMQLKNLLRATATFAHSSTQPASREVTPMATDH